MKLFGLKDENGKEYVIEADLRSCFHNVINVMPIEPTPKFKVGDWVYYSCPPNIKGLDDVFRIEDIRSTNDIGRYRLKKEEGVWHEANDCRFATQSEIESHLIKIAEKKGFKNGVKFKGLRFNRDCKMRWQVGKSMGENYRGYYKNEDCLNVEDVKNNVWELIYKQGQWATIIPDKKPLPKTKDEFYKMIKTYFDCNDGLPFPTPIEEFLDEYED